MSNNVDLDLGALVEAEKPKIIRFPDGREAKFYRLPMSQLIKLAMFGKKYNEVKNLLNNDGSVDGGKLSEDPGLMIDLVSDLVTALEEIIPEMKGQNLNEQQLFALLNIIIGDSIPSQPNVSIEGGDSEQKKTQ